MRNVGVGVLVVLVVVRVRVNGGQVGGHVALVVIIGGGGGGTGGGGSSSSARVVLVLELLVVVDLYVVLDAGGRIRLLWGLNLVAKAGGWLIRNVFVLVLLFVTVLLNVRVSWTRRLHRSRSGIVGLIEVYVAD